MRCPACGPTAISGRPERTTQGYRRFRCGNCGKQFNERGGGVLNRAQYPSDVIALVVLWRLRYKLSLRDLAEMFLTRGFIFSYEAVRDWEAKLTPALAENLRRRRKGRVGRSWYVGETYIRVRGRWRISIARLIATARWWTSCSASTATSQPPRHSFDRPRRSQASRPIGSPPTAMMPIPEPSGPSSANTCGIGRAAISTTDLSRTIAASRADVDRCLD